MKSRLTEAQVEEVQQKYLTGKFTQEELARDYGVSQASISRVMHGQRRHRKAFRELDDVDEQILRCIENAEGLSMVDVYRCYNLEANHTLSEQFIRYRVNTLEKMGRIEIVKVKGKPTIRKCYIA